MKHVVSDDSSPTSDCSVPDPAGLSSARPGPSPLPEPLPPLAAATLQPAPLYPAPPNIDPPSTALLGMPGGDSVGRSPSLAGLAASEPLALPPTDAGSSDNPHDLDSGGGSSRSLTAGRTGDLERDPTVISQRPIAAPAEFTRSLSLIELARSLEGRHLHHFAVGRMIGGGGMGAVFRGRDLRLDRDVAIKVIPESRRDPETLRRFRMEAQSAARLDHPNIARVYDIGEDEAWNYIVFEFIDGINLRDLVQMEGPMSIDDAVYTTRQVAEALQHAHDRDVVHRDIKPSNVIITPTGIAKVVDMGLARNTAMDRSAGDQTASGVTLGTFDYISPEQARDPRDADVRSDLYSLGCTLFYMLTGQPPFPDGTALQKLLNHGSQPPPDPRQWRDDISDQLYAVLAKLMAKRPSDRYQKPLELINDLLLIAQLEGLPRSRTPGSILMRPTIAQRTLLESHLPWIVPMSALLLSAFWLQSADSLTSSLDLPIPTLRGPAASSRAAAVSRSGSPEAPGQSEGSELGTPHAPLRTDSRGAIPAAASPVTPDSGRIVEPPLQPALLASGLPSPGTPGQATPAGTGGNTAGGLVVPLAPGAQPAFDVTRGGASASAAETVARLRGRTPDSQAASASPTATTAADDRQVPLAAGADATPGRTVGSAAAATTSSTEAGSSPTASTASTAGSIEGSVEPRLPSPLSRDTIVVTKSEPTDVGTNTLWSTSLAEALTRAAMVPDVRVIELRDPIELNHVLSIPRSGLTLRAPPGKSIDIVLDGEHAYAMGWESWIDVQRVAFRCERIRFTCRNNMRQPQAIFALRAGGQLELVECWATMASNDGAPLGSCVLVSEPDRPREAGMPLGSTGGASSEKTPGGGPSPNFGSTGSGLASDTTQPAPSTSTAPKLASSPMPASSASSTTPPHTAPGPGAANASVSSPSAASSSGASSAGVPSAGVSADGEPVAIALRGCLVRGNQNLVAMRTACRAEITLDKTCAILEGRVLTIRGLEGDRMPPVVRLNMDLSTLVCRQGFAAVQTSFALRAPLTLMRTAKLCAFWSPSMVPHITIDGIADQGVLDELLQLRGEENAYDQNIETLCQCRFADGKHIDFSFRDATGEWFRERGNDNSLRWQSPVPPQRPLEEQMPEDYRLRSGMFVPGFPPSAAVTASLEGDVAD